MEVLIWNIRGKNQTFDTCIRTVDVRLHDRDGNSTTRQNLGDGSGVRTTLVEEGGHVHSVIFRDKANLHSITKAHLNCIVAVSVVRIASQKHLIAIVNIPSDYLWPPFVMNASYHEIQGAQWSASLSFLSILLFSPLAFLSLPRLLLCLDRLPLFRRLSPRFGGKHRFNGLVEFLAFFLGHFPIGDYALQGGRKKADRWQVG